MSDLSNIVKKEVKELLTPGSVASVIIMMVLFAGLGGLIGEEVQKSAVLPTIGIANYEDQYIETEYGSWDAYDFLISFYLSSGDKRITPSNVEDFVIKMDKGNILEQMESTGASVVLVLGDDFKKNIEDSMDAATSGEGGPYEKGDIYQYYLY